MIGIVDQLGAFIDETDLASSKLTPCFLAFAAAFRSSHSK
jgi:hypothetical protein